MGGQSTPLSTCVLRVNVQCCAKGPVKVKNKLQKLQGVYSINIDSKNGLVSVLGFEDPATLEKAMADIGKKSEVLLFEKDPLLAKNKVEEFLKKKKQKERDRKHHCSDCHSKSKKTISRNTPQCSDSDSDDGQHDEGCTFAHSNEVQKWKHVKSNKDAVQCANDTAVMAYPNNGMRGNAVGGGRGGRFGPSFDVDGGYLPSGYSRPNHMSIPYGYQGYHPPGFHMPLLRPQMLPPSSIPPPLQLPPPQRPLIKPPPRPQMALPNLYAFYSGQTEPPIGNSMFHIFSDENVSACCIM